MTRSFSYLKRIAIKRFGSFSDKSVGPFTPHLNVVYGANEAGKTTLAAFVAGVLFGWTEARGLRNTYKPEDGERSGELLFEPRDLEAFELMRQEDLRKQSGVRGAHARVERIETEQKPHQGDASRETMDESKGEVPDETLFRLSRSRNAQGVRGDDFLLEDIDKDTYETMFKLDSDELRSLRDTNDITARLLTAGSGTSSSPARALREILSRLDRLTSRAAAADDSLVNLTTKRAEVKRQIVQAVDEAEALVQQNREYRQLEPEREGMAELLSTLNARIETLSAHQASLEAIEDEYDRARLECNRLEQELEKVGDVPYSEDEVPEHLIALGAASERALRSKLQQLEQEQARAAHAVDTARDAYIASLATFEALQESEATEAERPKRIVGMALVAIPLAFMAGGITLIHLGKEHGSFTIFVLGCCLVLSALIIGAAASLAALRPNKRVNQREERVNSARWVMLQDKKKLEACQTEQTMLAQRIKLHLQQEGLAAAQGSLARASELLDSAKDVRSARALHEQRIQALHSRLSQLEQTIEELASQRKRLFERAGLNQVSTIVDLDERLAHAISQRNDLIEASERINHRCGELSRILSEARERRDMELLKQRSQELRTRYQDSATEYARLLVAKRLLETSIASWEAKSQPLVYKTASRLMSLMTKGRWKNVRMLEGGQLVVTDAEGTQREPRFLSLGTCQQLYLSLRIALLLAAEDVGRNVPILADDILVNFDEERRIGAACALAELARTRQVIILTCHKDVVALLRQVDNEANVIEL